MTTLQSKFLFYSMIFRALHKPQLSNISSILFFLSLLLFSYSFQPPPSPMTQTASMIWQHHYLNILPCILPQRTCTHGSLQVKRLLPTPQLAQLLLITRFKHYLLCNTFPHLTELKPPHLSLGQSIPHSGTYQVLVGKEPTCQYRKDLLRRAWQFTQYSAWRMPRREEPGRLWPIGWQRVRSN